MQQIDKLLPETATNCCPKQQYCRSTCQSRRFWQQFVAWRGQAFRFRTESCAWRNTASEPKKMRPEIASGGHETDMLFICRASYVTE